MAKQRAASRRRSGTDGGDADRYCCTKTLYRICVSGYGSQMEAGNGNSLPTGTEKVTVKYSYVH